MPVDKNTFWKKFEELGFYYRVQGGILKQAPIKPNNEIDIDQNIIVKNISYNLQALNILEKINHEFGTNFQYSDFKTSIS